MATRSKNRLYLSEAQVQSQCIGWLTAHGIMHWRQNTGAFKLDNRYIRAGRKGISDIIGCLPDGRFLAIEVKRENGGKVSEDQLLFLQQVIQSNGVAMIVHSLDDLIKQMAENGVI